MAGTAESKAKEQLNKYLKGTKNNPALGKAGNPFPLVGGPERDPMFGLEVTVHSATTKGVELYDVDGGGRRVYSKLMDWLAARGITQQKALDGELPETQNIDGTTKIGLGPDSVNVGELVVCGCTAPDIYIDLTPVVYPVPSIV